MSPENILRIIIITIYFSLLIYYISKYKKEFIKLIFFSTFVSMITAMINFILMIYNFNQSITNFFFGENLPAQFYISLIISFKNVLLFTGVTVLISIIIMLYKGFQDNFLINNYKKIIPVVLLSYLIYYVWPLFFILFILSENPLST
jgi:hypothetical protein